MRLALCRLLLVISPVGAVHPQGVAGTTITGIVFDSLSGRVLSDASVQVIRPDSANTGTTYSRFATTDARGIYRIESVPPGRYAIGFFHPAIDSLGVDIPLRVVEVLTSSEVRADLAVPSHLGLNLLLCGREGATDSTAAIIGFVRDARTSAPLRAASVLLEWSDLVVRGGALHEEPAQLSTATRNDGWYAFCNVPVSWMMQLRAASGPDTSGAIAAQLTGRKVTMHNLYLGPAVRIERASSDSVRPAGGIRVIWSGNARLTGRVRSSDGRPLSGARVTVAGTEAIATSSETGAFVLIDLPSGSQTLEARAIGFLPERTTLHLRPDSANATDTTIVLTRLRTFLDTVRVTASRIYSADVTGFESRQRAHLGHFIDRAAIDKQNPFYPSDLVRMIPGVEVAQAGVGFFGKFIYMKSPFIAGRICRPSLYLDGAFYRPDEAQLDDLVSPDQIEGIEIYTRQSQAPAQFTNTMSGCGSVVVWTRHNPRKKE